MRAGLRRVAIGIKYHAFDSMTKEPSYLSALLILTVLCAALFVAGETVGLSSINRGRFYR